MKVVGVVVVFVMVFVSVSAARGRGEHDARLMREEGMAAQPLLKKYMELRELYGGAAETAAIARGKKGLGDGRDGLTNTVVFKVRDTGSATNRSGTAMQRAAALAARRAGLEEPTRVFRPAGIHEARHRQFGLHLWFHAKVAPGDDDIYHATNTGGDGDDDADEGTGHIATSRLVMGVARLLTDEDDLIAEAAIRPEPSPSASAPRRAGRMRQTATMADTDEDTNESDTEASPRPSDAMSDTSSTSSSQETYVPNDPFFQFQMSHYSTINLSSAWANSTGSADIVVSVVDTGVDEFHPDLIQNLWANTGEVCGNNVDDDNNGYVDDCHGYNFALGTGLKLKTPSDSHGTHVAGTIAAKGNNGLGVAGVAGGGSGQNYDGMQWAGGNTSSGTKLMVCVVFGEKKAGGFDEAIVYAADNGALITNNSWGFTRPGISDPALLDAIDYFIANGNGGGLVDDGGFVLFAAGNYNSMGAYYPAFYESTIAVAAVDNQNEKATFSNYGTWVDISAPGVNIYSTFNTPIAYGQLSGTSMATPHVSGVLALMVDHNRGLPRATYIDCLLGTTLHNGASSYAQYMGSGLLQADKAINCVGSGDTSAGSPSLPPMPPPPDIADLAECESICTHTIKIMLQTDDYPDETSWKVVTSGNTACEIAMRPMTRNIATEGPYKRNTDDGDTTNEMYTEEIGNLCAGETYNVVMIDKYGTCVRVCVLLYEYTSTSLNDRVEHNACVVLCVYVLTN